MDGRFIVIEGIDGCGSTTQVKRLGATLQARGVSVHLTCEPSSGPIGQLIRQALQLRLVRGDGGTAGFTAEAMALLFAADRVDHVAVEIEPALERGVVVISDRYDLSSLAYQSATAAGGATIVPWLRELNRRARRPDLTIVVDVSPETAEQRRRARGGPPELFEKTELQRRLAELYLQAEQLVPGDPLVHVSGEGEPEQVAARIEAAVRPWLHRA